MGKNVNSVAGLPPRPPSNLMVGTQRPKSAPPAPVAAPFPAPVPALALAAAVVVAAAAAAAVVVATAPPAAPAAAANAKDELEIMFNTRVLGHLPELTAAAQTSLPAFATVVAAAAAAVVVATAPAPALPPALPPAPAAGCTVAPVES